MRTPTLMKSSGDQLRKRRVCNGEDVANNGPTTDIDLPETPSSDSVTPVKQGITSPHSVNTRDVSFPLYEKEFIPSWMAGNPFIISYYRSGYTTSQCFKSILAMHNETANIWTHLIGLVIVSVLFVHVLLHVGLSRAEDYVVFSLFELGNLIMLGGSSMYHILSGHHLECVHNTALALDYFGITFMIIGSFYPPVFYMFSCMPVVRAAYLTAITSLGFLGLVGPFFSFFSSLSFYWPRLLLYSSLAAVGVLPGMHFYFGLPVNELTQPMCESLFLMLLIYLVGMLIYVFKVPERWYPGAFDLWMHSHQLWHFFVLAAAVLHYFTCIGIFQFWSITGDASGECA